MQRLGQNPYSVAVGVRLRLGTKIMNDMSHLDRAVRQREDESGRICAS
jgi:hypothetical protein